ncbi:MAG: peptide-methionine (S)-S-oxide reductase MsrA, partial [Nanoarchaeota archaeon]
FMGGTTKNPSYKDVCAGDTGHVEVCQVTFDPKRISYDKLLAVFWSIHDPTQVDRQGPDRGTQYRSVIFYHSTAQKAAAEKSLMAQQKKRSKPIATRIEPTTTFDRAEEYHQHYIERTGDASCLR